MKRFALIAILLLAFVSRAAAAISLVAIGAGATNTGTTPFTVPCTMANLLPVKTNDLLLAQISVYDSSGSAVTFAVTAPTGWSIWPGYPNTNFAAGNRTDADFLYYTYGGPPIGTRFTIADGGAHAGNWNCRLWQFRGTKLGTPYDGAASTATAMGAVTTLATIPVSTTAVDALLVICANSDHTISSFSGAPTLSLGYSDNIDIDVRAGYLLPFTGTSAAYACNSTSSTTMEGEQVLIAPTAIPSTTVLDNSCASTGCVGTPLAKTWAFDPLSKNMAVESDGVWSPMPAPPTPPAGVCYGAACSGAPSPPALVGQVTYSPGSHTYNGTMYTVYGDGVHDDTASLQAAVTQGDVLVEPPSAFYYIKPSGGGQASIFMPAGRNLRCDTNNNAAGGTVAFSGVTNPGSLPSASYIIFDWVSTNNGSIFWCQFRGPGYNAPGQPPVANESTSEQPIVVQGTGSGQVIAENDFNGIGGNVGAVDVHRDSSNNLPSNVTIEYNTFEHCGIQDALIDAGSNSTVTHNTSFDCSNGSENSIHTNPFTGHVWSYNKWTFQYGTGWCGSGRGNGNEPTDGGCNQATGGLACHDAVNPGNACLPSETGDYSGVTFKYNSINYISGSSTITGVGLFEANYNPSVNNGCWYANAPGIILPAVYISNVYTSNVGVYCAPGSPGSNQ